MNEQQQPKPSTPGSHGDQQTASGERNIQANASTVSVTSEQGDTVGGNKFIIEKAYFGPPPDNTPKLTEALKLLDSLPLDGVPAPAPLPTPHRMPLGRNPLFVGREADLRALAATLKGGTTAAIGQVAAATGLGGIGKTQLAAEFVHRYGHFFAGGVFWLSFADAQAVAGEMVAAGATLDLPSFSTLKFEDQLARVRQVWREPIPRLLVFDNCEDEKLLEEWRPLTGGCRILVTSRRASWDPVLGVTVRALDVLPRDQSVALLRQFRPDLPADDTDLAAIAAELGDLPLALHLAGSFLRLNRFDMSPADYLAELRTTALLEHPSLHQTDQTRSATNHPLHVRRTLALSYDQLDTNEPADALARLLLLHASHFALGEPLPRDLVRASLGAQASGSPFSDAVRRLVELGLVDELSNGSMRMHRLIGALVCPPTPDAAIAEAVEQIVLERARQLHEQGSPAAMLPILPHLHTVAERATKRDDAQAISLWLALGQYLEEAGRYSDARAAYEQALGIQRALFGEQHTVTASCLNALGEVLWRQSEYLAAQTALESALAIRRALLNDNHPETARTLNSLGLVANSQADYSLARVYYEQALQMRRETLGEKHKATAESLNDLAVLLSQLSEYSAARPLYEQALSIREQALGPLHPDTASSLNNLANLLYNQGDYAAARPLFERALSIREQALGPLHPDTAQSLNNLAGIYESQSDYGATRPLFERALAIWEQTLGPLHPDTATSLNNLAYLLQNQGDYAAARPLVERALSIRENTLGPLHPDTAISLNNLADLLRAQGNYRTARPLYERALSIRENTLGPLHPDTASSLNNVALLLQSQGDYAAARPLFERALTITEQTLGPLHPDTASSLNNLAGLFRAQGDYTAAWPLFERALSILEHTLGPLHPDTATSLTNLGTLLQEQGNYREAQPYLERAIEISRVALGDSHPDTARCLNNLAALLAVRHDYLGAAKHMRQALRVLEVSLGAKHPTTQQARYNLAAAEINVPAGFRSLKPDVARAALQWGKQAGKKQK